MNLNDLRKNAYGAEPVKSNPSEAQEPLKKEDLKGFKKFGAEAAAEILKNQGLSMKRKKKAKSRFTAGLQNSFS